MTEITLNEANEIKKLIEEYRSNKSYLEAIKLGLTKDTNITFSTGWLIKKRWNMNIPSNIISKELDKQISSQEEMINYYKDKLLLL